MRYRIWVNVRDLGWLPTLVEFASRSAAENWAAEVSAMDAPLIQAKLDDEGVLVPKEAVRCFSVREEEMSARKQG